MFEWGLPNATLFFLSMAFVGLLLWKAWSTRREASAGKQGLRLLLVLVCAALAVVCLPSLLAVQKWLTKLALPVGLLWLGLIVLAVVLWRRHLRLWSFVVGLLWLLLTLAGNDAVSRRLLAGLEREYAALDPLAVASPSKPFDLIVALGGSTSQTPAGQAQLTEAGDRVVVAARLYHAGHARLLAATGEPNVELLGPGRHPADEARRIWEGLGIPKGAMLVLDGGTTKTEFQVIADVAEERDLQRIGVVTSAWHMRRALRLAQAAGLNVEPLPSHFTGVVPGWRRTALVPQAQALDETSRALKEYLARIVGR